MIPRYIFPQYNILQSSFKKHQHSTLLKFTNIIKQTQYIIELRDLRIPLSSRNPLFEYLFDKEKAKNNNNNKTKKRLVIYTQGDYFYQNKNKNNNEIKYSTVYNKLKELHSNGGSDFMILDCRSIQDISKKLIPYLKYQYDLVEQETKSYLPLGFKIMICGIPNVGKSTLINSLRTIGFAGGGSNSNNNSGVKLNKKNRNNVCKTGNISGVTTKVSELIKINTYKNGIYLYDTPGISIPLSVLKNSENNGNSDNRIYSIMSVNEQGNSWINTNSIIRADYYLFLLNLLNEPYLPLSTVISTNTLTSHDTEPYKSNDILKVLQRYKRDVLLRQPQGYQYRTISENELAQKWISYVINDLKIKIITYDIDLLNMNQKLYHQLLIKDINNLSKEYLNKISSLSSSSSSSSTSSSNNGRSNLNKLF